MMTIESDANKVLAIARRYAHVMGGEGAITLSVTQMKTLAKANRRRNGEAHDPLDRHYPKKLYGLEVKKRIE